MGTDHSKPQGDTVPLPPYVDPPKDSDEEPPAAAAEAVVNEAAAAAASPGSNSEESLGSKAFWAVFALVSVGLVTVFAPPGTMSEGSRILVRVLVDLVMLVAIAIASVSWGDSETFISPNLVPVLASMAMVVAVASGSLTMGPTVDEYAMTISFFCGFYNSARMGMTVFSLYCHFIGGIALLFVFGTPPWTIDLIIIAWTASYNITLEAILERIWFWGDLVDEVCFRD